MAYTLITAAALKAAMAPITKLETLYEKADSTTKKQIKGDLPDKAKKVQTALEADVAIYKKNADQRYLNIDDRLARAVGLVKKGQDALAAYAKSQKFIDLMPANVAVTAYEQLMQLEKQDDKDYNVAQAAYRQSPAKLDWLDKMMGDKYTAGFREIRKATIDEGKKHIQPKLTKMRKLGEMIADIAKRADTVSKVGGATIEEVRTTLLDLASEVRTALDARDRQTFGKDIEDVAKGADSVLETIQGKKPLSMAESILDGVLGSIKSAKEAGTIYRKRMTDQIDSVSAPHLADKQVAATVKMLKLLSSEIDKKLKALPPHYQRGLKALTAYRKKLEK